MLCSTVVQSTRSGAASKTQKNIGTRDEKRTEGAMAFYDIDCNNNNHHHHYHYYYHYLYKPLKWFALNWQHRFKFRALPEESINRRVCLYRLIGLSAPAIR
jgi:hypothetical protein